MAIPLLDPLDIDDIVITADALLTQREFARYLVKVYTKSGRGQAHCSCHVCGTSPLQVSRHRRL